MYEFGKGALKFTDHRSSINRTPITSNPPLPVPNYWKPRPRRYMSSGQLVFIREYVSSATPTPVITYTIGSPLPTINPVTGDVFTLEESHQLALATLKTSFSLVPYYPSRVFSYHLPITRLRESSWRPAAYLHLPIDR